MFNLICMLLVAAPSANVSVQRNLSYYNGPDRDAIRHSYDLYLPVGKERFPTVVFVHGGGWAMGSKNGFLALPGHKAADFGEFFADRGIAVAMINYRLSPKVKHPEHAIDVARAIGEIRRNIPKNGGDPNKLFLMGHSAGGHLVALMGTDPKYLMAEGLTPNMIRGIMPISGVFDLKGDMSLNLGDGAAGPGAFFKHVFGNDPADYKSASPIAHAHSGMPPFLIAYADADLATLPQQAIAFHALLVKQGNDAEKVFMKDRGHQTILRDMIKPGDPLGKAVLDFIETKSSKERQ